MTFFKNLYTMLRSWPGVWPSERVPQTLGLRQNAWARSGIDWGGE